MKPNRVFLGSVTCVVLIAARLLADNVASNSVLTTPAVYVPDTSHQNDQLTNGILAWQDIVLETNAAAADTDSHFVFAFTNVSSDNVAILDVHPSCGCTTAQLPTLPWIVPAGTNEQFGVTVNLAGKSGTIYKTIKVTTDKGYTQLMVKINISALVLPSLSDADRALGMEKAKADRQSIFKNDCVTCHVKPGEGKFAQALYDADCGICHEAEHRATMVPDLHNLKTPTNDQFWQTWIAHGKPGSLMPAFSTADGGPLSDMQIASLSAYLNTAIPSHVAPAPQ
jgi:mono/diheme cytochrome c family protein